MRGPGPTTVVGPRRVGRPPGAGRRRDAGAPASDRGPRRAAGTRVAWTSSRRRTPRRTGRVPARGRACVRHPAAAPGRALPLPGFRPRPDRSAKAPSPETPAPALPPVDGVRCSRYPYSRCCPDRPRWHPRSARPTPPRPRDHRDAVRRCARRHRRSPERHPCRRRSPRRSRIRTLEKGPDKGPDTGRRLNRGPHQPAGVRTVRQPDQRGRHDDRRRGPNAAPTPRSSTHPTSHRPQRRAPGPTTGAGPRLPWWTGDFTEVTGVAPTAR